MKYGAIGFFEAPRKKAIGLFEKPGSLRNRSEIQWSTKRRETTRNN